MALRGLQKKPHPAQTGLHRSAGAPISGRPANLISPKLRDFLDLHRVPLGSAAETNIGIAQLFFQYNHITRFFNLKSFRQPPAFFD
jgi:hypothetical protein